jgi:hypothetical protein
MMTVIWLLISCLRLAALIVEWAARFAHRHWFGLGITAGVFAALSAAVWLLARPKRFIKTQPPGLTKKVVEVTMNGLLGKWMTNLNWAGTTIPLPGFVLMMFWLGPKLPVVNGYVRLHEFVHVQQDEDNGWWFISWAKYLWEMVVEAKSHGTWSMLLPWNWYALYGAGYWNNKFEKAAYAIEYAAEDAGTLPDWAK